ncbi:MAG: N-(5'-phosphoribosyl)anthranilate isomerase [Acidithiobacillales bacterium SM23_46]|nr:MAG: N-(5'-phosphoribosyl)anthranilate isomerase [Acidithiobacillales bacterium SM23_46]KPL28032.1 MAG: N-(5'-phosphoribosyl)anthranilate isomerase [Acidithiobacillales bacterium SM1_46]
MPTRIKICGITRPDDGLAAARAGADAIGLVFEPRSPRFVGTEQALAVVRALPPFIKVVGLFVNAAAEQVRDVMGRVPLDLLQFHGDEPADFCRIFSRPYLKAISMREGIDVRTAVGRYPDTAAVLLDTHHVQLAGGTGERFDWSRIPTDLGKPLVLAGGLTPDNVSAAVRQVRPYAVDVSSGVEQSKGIKDAHKITAFVEAVRRSD